MRQLYIRQKVFKITDKYPITDGEGRIFYHVDQDFRLIGHTVHVFRADGSRLFTIDRQLFKLLPQYVVSFEDGNSITLKSRFTFFRRAIDIDPDRLGLRLEGDFIDHNFSVYRGSQLIGSIHKAWLSWGDNYELRIFEETYEALFIAIVIAVDRLIDEAQSNN